MRYNGNGPSVWCVKSGPKPPQGHENHRSNPPPLIPGPIVGRNPAAWGPAADKERIAELGRKEEDKDGRVAGEGSSVGCRRLYESWVPLAAGEGEEAAAACREWVLRALEVTTVAISLVMQCKGAACVICKQQLLGTMIGENRQLVTNDPVEFEK